MTKVRTGGKCKLTPKKKRCVEEYLVDLNWTQAALRAGFAKSTAKKKSQLWVGESRNLSQCPEMYDYLQELMEARSKRTQVTADRVLEELARCAFFDPRRMFDEDGKLRYVPEMDEEIAAAVAGLDVMITHTTKGKDKKNDEWYETSKIRLVDKKGCLELLMRHLGMFVEGVYKHRQDGPWKIIIEMIEADGKNTDDNSG